MILTELLCIPNIQPPLVTADRVNIGLPIAALHLVTRCLPWLPGDFGIVGRWRAVCVTALQQSNSDAAAIGIVVVSLQRCFSVTDHPDKELEEQLRSVSSVDELMTLLYPESWKMFKCQLRQGQSSFDTRRDGNLKFAAAHSNYNAEIWKSIESEWRKTQCMPREVCVDVGKEFGASTNTFFKPPCVSLYRCGGCCNSEGLHCMNTSSTYVSKTVSFNRTQPVIRICNGE
ncbi:unnamed protein product [Ranitomeya imitator]|uniref:Platelet-derived growth factor (PDGF) family profile domain-containing protein n=1 Tax=Ranitomeya imitator TaxID=111125 RepID=A0ABN9MC64_9NEOB|nr:unnamed protein product [Ranitomeya imitator]